VIIISNKSNGLKSLLIAPFVIFHLVAGVISKIPQPKSHQPLHLKPSKKNRPYQTPQDTRFSATQWSTLPSLTKNPKITRTALLATINLRLSDAEDIFNI